jgi:hypothetical protein
VAAAIIISASGCGGGGEPPTPAALALQREDLVVVSRALSQVAAPVALEVAASKEAWKLIVDGLPRVIPASTAAAIAAAARSAERLPLPQPIGEAEARKLTGPGSAFAGVYRDYALLASRGWRLIDAAVGEITSGSPGGARFARANVALYIESVYDAHFTLAQVGKKLIAAYRKLGGAGVFAATLAPAQVEALAATYSEASVRLHPRVGVRLGS